MELVNRFRKDERGSISLLIMSLFIATILIMAIMTDISSVYLAKRSLTQATEAAAQRGSRNLDLERYYRGEYNVSKFQLGIVGLSDTDPGIPIDCGSGLRDAIGALNDWSNSGAPVMRSGMERISLIDSSCDGFEISLRTSSVVSLPFVIPGTSFEKITIYSNVGSVNERKLTTNFYGVDIGGGDGR